MIKKLKYLVQFFFILILYFFFKIIGLKTASNFGSKIFKFLGPFFRSNNLVKENIHTAFKNIGSDRIDNIKKGMWENYGRIFAEYAYIKNFRINNNDEYIKIIGLETLKDIINKKKQVIFISGHFSNFELMAMQLEKHGIKLAAIYRPLNNLFLNPLMEKIRKRYICKKQIKKGISGVKESLKVFREGYSIALMIDQRVSEGAKVNFFNKKAFTTTIPAQFNKKFNCDIVPVYIQRIYPCKFEVYISKPLNYSKNDTIEKITQDLNIVLEEMIKKNPEQWIWTHNRWK